MTDRELLERAAKAAGIDVHFDNAQWDRFWVNGGGFWNPLTDDGDALRLAVKLNMRVSVGQVDWMGSDYVGSFSTPEEVEGDPYAATRRAIVRAAAELANG